MRDASRGHAKASRGSTLTSEKHGERVEDTFGHFIGSIKLRHFWKLFPRPSIVHLGCGARPYKPPAADDENDWDLAKKEDPMIASRERTGGWIAALSHDSDALRSWPQKISH